MSANKKQIQDRIVLLVREVLPKRLAKSDIRPMLHLQRDLGMDSMGMTTLAFRIEEEFGIDWSQLDNHAINIANIWTVADVINAVELLSASNNESGRAI